MAATVAEVVVVVAGGGETPAAAAVKKAAAGGLETETLGTRAGAVILAPVSPVEVSNE